jgi:hypothetical protein
MRIGQLRPLGFAVNTADGRLTFGDTEPRAQEMFPYTLLLRFIGKKSFDFNQRSSAANHQSCYDRSSAATSMSLIGC